MTARLAIPLFVLGTSMLMATPAYACGGMFCNVATPVDQAAERIVFTFEDNQTVTTEVQISYEGAAPDFAWVVPVPSEPELFASNDAMFTILANNTIPSFFPVSDEYGLGSISLGCAEYAMMKMDDGGGSSFGVSVVSEGVVGPYDTVVLQASTADMLVNWLQEQGYNLPSTLDTALAPYVASGQYFVALKLADGQDTGDLTPLGMRYHATAASIPIQLTAVAAVQDLPIEVFVLGSARAVPDNYLHVQINEAAIDWYNLGNNYRDVVARAVDEAGGQAFVTDFSGSTDFLANAIWLPGRVDVGTLGAETDPLKWMEDIIFSGLPASAQLTALMLRFVPPPEGVDSTDFLNCPTCYEGQVDRSGFDPTVATAALQAEVLSVMAEQQQRISSADHITRLFTTMDPEEMTADPMFVLNKDLPQEVVLAHTATDHVEEAIGGRVVARTLELADGRRYKLHDPENLDALKDVRSPAALIIEDLGASGDGTVVFDGTEAAEDAARAFSGCGSQGNAAAARSPALMLLVGMLRRRKL